MSQSSSGTKPPCVALGFGATVGTGFGVTGGDVPVGAAVAWAHAGVVGTAVGMGAGAGAADALATGVELTAADGAAETVAVGIEVAVSVGGGTARVAAGVVALGQMACAVATP